MFIYISPAGWYLIGASTLFLLLFFLFVLFYFKVKQKQNELLLKEQRTESEYKQLILNTQLEIQEQTLNTVSQEIHDNIGQVLGLVKLNLNNLLIKDPGNPKLTTTKDLVGKAINDLRSLTRSLHSDRIADLGLAEAIAQELSTLQNTGQFTTDLQIEGNIYRLPTQQEMVFFRMVQESLHNAIKHSEAQDIMVILNYAPSLFSLTIKDNGKGFDHSLLNATQKGIGLKSMQNRANLIGASFFIDSLPSKGTTITITIPPNDTTGK